MYVGARSFGQVAGKRTLQPSVQEATQAQMEAATATGVFVSPGQAKNHPGVAKAWVIFTTTGGSGTASTGVTVAASHNVTSVVRTAAGVFTLNWTTPFSSANYVLVGIAKRSSTGSQDCQVELLATGGALASGAARIVTAVAGTPANIITTMITAFGDQ